MEQNYLRNCSGEGQAGVDSIKIGISHMRRCEASFLNQKVQVGVYPAFQAFR